MKDSRRRLLIDVSEEQYQRIDRFLMKGVRKQVLGYLISDLIEMLEEDAPRVIASVLCRDMSAKDILKME